MTGGDGAELTLADTGAVNWRFEVALIGEVPLQHRCNQAGNGTIVVKGRLPGCITQILGQAD